MSDAPAFSSTPCSLVKLADMISTRVTASNAPSPTLPSSLPRHTAPIGYENMRTLLCAGERVDCRARRGIGEAQGGVQTVWHRPDSSLRVNQDLIRYVLLYIRAMCGRTQAMDCMILGQAIR